MSWLAGQLSGAIDPEGESGFATNRSLRRENARLLQANRDLAAQVTALRAQFNQAISISRTIDGIAAKQSDLKQELASVKRERDEFGSRLQMSQQMNQQLRQTIDDLQSRPPFSPSARQPKPTHQADIEQLRSQLASERAEREKIKSSLDRFEFELDSLWQAASSYFGTRVDSQHGLIDCFLSGRRSSEDEYVINCLLLKLKRARRSLSENTNSKSQIDAKLSALSQKLAQKDQEIAELQRQTKDLAAEIDSLTTQKCELVQEVREKESRLNLVDFQNQDAQHRHKKDVSQKLIDTIEKLNACAALNEKLKRRLARCKPLNDRCRELESAIRDLENRDLSTKAELERSAAISAESRKQMEVLQAQLEWSREDVAARRQEIDRLNEAVLEREGQVRQHARDVSKAHQERMILSAQLQQPEGIRQDLEKRLQVLRSRQMDSDREHTKLQSKLSGAPKPPDFSDIAPAEGWTSPELPEELRGVLNDVARSPSVPLIVRIQRAFDAICRWFKVRTERLERELREEREASSSLHQKIDVFVKFWSSVMPEVRINFDLLLTDDLTRCVLGDAILALKTRIEGLQKENAQLQGQLAEMRELLDANSAGDAREEIVRLRRALAEAERHVQCYKAQRTKTLRLVAAAKSKMNRTHQQCLALKKEKKELREHVADVDSTIAERNRLKNEVSRLTAQQENLEKCNSDLSAAIVNLQRRKEELEQHLRSISEMNKDVDRKHKEQMTRERQKAEMKYQQLNEQMHKLLADLQNSLRQLSEKAVRSDARKAELEDLNNGMVIKLQTLETRLDGAQLECERDKRALESQFNAKMLVRDAGHTKTLEEAKAAAIASRSRIIEAIARIFSGLIDGLNVSESNLEFALQSIRKRIDVLVARESSLRGILRLESAQSLEEAMMSLAYQRNRRSSYYL
jgi:DNA repair exonuclease SbcCD ATPase subunit